MGFCENIFSVRNSENGSHKVINVLGLKFKFKKKNTQDGNLMFFKDVKIYPPSAISEATIGKGTYIAQNSVISKTSIGKFCSIGPNLMCGFGIHPTEGISTSPCFYSTLKQNGMTYSLIDKIEERKFIKIGNDVFIGMNVSILDGVTIGDGAVIAAGAVVTRDVEPYSVVGGVPAKHIKYRFSKEICDELKKIAWWDWDDEKLKDVEKMFFNVEDFVRKYREED